MKNTDDKLKRMSFKDFTVVDYVPGEGQYINYQAQKRHRGTVGEEVEHLDEMEYASGRPPGKESKLSKKRQLIRDTKFTQQQAVKFFEDELPRKFNAKTDLGYWKSKDGNLYVDLRNRGTDLQLQAKEKTKPSAVKSYTNKYDTRESVEHLDEKVRPLEMTQAKYDSYPKNKKGKSGGKLYIIQNQKSGVTKGGVKFTSLGGGAGTTKVPVKIVKELPYKYEESVEQVDEGGILDKLRFKNKKTPNRGPSDYIKAGETHDIGGTKVKFTKAGNQGHIGYSWKKSNGKEGYEEYHPKRFKNHDEVKANIASEIKSQSKKHKGPIERPRGRESVEQVDEAFSVAQRIKAKQRMKKMSKRIQMAKKRSMKRAPTPEKLKLRAKKQAKNKLVKKWMKGQSKADLTFSQRANVEKRLKNASKKIDNMAKKMLPIVRIQDRERRANANSNKKEES